MKAIATTALIGLAYSTPSTSELPTNFPSQGHGQRLPWGGNFRPIKPSLPYQKPDGKVPGHLLNHLFGKVPKIGYADDEYFQMGDFADDEFSIITTIGGLIQKAKDKVTGSKIELDDVADNSLYSLADILRNWPNIKKERRQPDNTVAPPGTVG